MLNFFYQFRKNLRDTRGISLLVVMGLIFLLMVITTTTTSLVLGFMRTTSQVERANIAYSAAEGGIELALYDLANYKDGYETDPAQLVCGSGTSLIETNNFSDSCDSSAGDKYRFVNFTDSTLSGGRGFWQLFSRTLASGGKYYLPNPYFAGDKDGSLETGEWGELAKDSPISLSLLIDDDPTEANPADRFIYLSDSVDKKIIFDPGDGWDISKGVGSSEEILTWTFSALDGNGEEFALQGMIWESDFDDDCSGGAGVGDCFIFDFNDGLAHNPGPLNGDPYAGEDINRNLSHNSVSGLNRVSGVDEIFDYATPFGFIEDLNTAMDSATPLLDRWVSARLTINLIATLSETSRVVGNENDSLQFKLESDEAWADEHTFIISEGFAGNVKQTIETRFRSEGAIPIFSYVIFQ